MGRYEDLNIMTTNLLPRNKHSVKNYQTTIHRQIPKRDNDIYVITQHGDRLDNLANQFYKDSSLWWYIAKANNLFSIKFSSTLISSELIGR